MFALGRYRAHLLLCTNVSFVSALLPAFTHLHQFHITGYYTGSITEI